jgi:hypothetical protein
MGASSCNLDGTMIVHCSYHAIAEAHGYWYYSTSYTTLKQICKISNNEYFRAAGIVCHLASPIQPIPAIEKPLSLDALAQLLTRIWDEGDQPHFAFSFSVAGWP